MISGAVSMLASLQFWKVQPTQMVLPSPTSPALTSPPSATRRMFWLYTGHWPSGIRSMTNIKSPAWGECRLESHAKLAVGDAVEVFSNSRILAVFAKCT